MTRPTRFFVVLDGPRVVECFDLSDHCQYMPPCGGCGQCCAEQAVWSGWAHAEVTLRPGARPSVRRMEAS